MTVIIKKKLLMWLLIMACLSPLLVAGFSVWYANRVQAIQNERWHRIQHESDARWCATFGAILADKTPPNNPRSREIQDNIRKLSNWYGCEAK